MDRSPIDQLFFELYGFYPNKAGQAYELLVAASFKIITGRQISYDQHVRGKYSQTDYQVDGIINDDKSMVEAKDYTIEGRKVGRGDIQKMQGALSDLDFETGIFVSATDFTKPARKYSDSTEENPLQKEIDLYHIRPSLISDEEGRVKKFVVDLTVILPDFMGGEFLCAWTKDAEEKIAENGLIGKPLRLDTFYNENGDHDSSMEDFTYHNQPILVNMEDDFSIGCWLLHGKYIKYEEQLLGLKGMVYKIPYTRNTTTITIESDGKPKILIKSDDGTINKLLTDEELRKIIFKNDKTL